MQIELTPAQRKQLRADAHHLQPVVMIGDKGLSQAVQKECEQALDTHGLIKVRVANDDRAEREAIFARLADALNAAAVQHIGKLLVLWRPMPDKKSDQTGEESEGKGPRELKFTRNSRRGGQRPSVRRLRVLGNERLTPGGKIKKARKAQTSIKKKRGS